MSRYEDDQFHISVDVDEFLGTAKNSVIVMVEGGKYFVAKSQVDNLREIEEHLAHPDSSDHVVEEICVPRWLAKSNGWIDDED